MHRDADDRAGHDDRERGVAVDPGGSGLFAGGPGLGGQRVPDRVRRAAAAGRAARGPGRAAGRVPDRAGCVHGGLAGVRAGGEPGDAHRGAVRAGHRRRDDLRGDPGHDRDHVPRAAGAGPGDRRVRLRRLRGRGGRAAGRRDPHPGAELALDLLRQPAHRRDHRRLRGADHRPGPGRGPAGGHGRARRAADHRGHDAGRVHHRGSGRAARLAGPEDARPGRRLAGPARRVHRPAAHGAAPADAAADLRLPQRDRREPGPGAGHRGDVRDVLPRLAVPAAGPGLPPAADRAGVPARRRGHGRRCRSGTPTGW